MISRSIAAVVAIAVATVALSTSPASAQGIGRVSPAAARTEAATVAQPQAVAFARDVSFPQCATALPRVQSADFGILGTDNGMSFTRNPCLQRQLAWAKHLPGPPAFYANTGNPGPGRAAHWPLGQTSPRVCSSADPNSIGCAYDYGWNSAWQSYKNAVDAAQRLHRVDRDNARRRAANVDWWLDVETMNSWQAGHGNETLGAQQRDVATIAGEVDALRQAGVAMIGIYSTSYQWGLITGGSHVTNGRFAGMAQWLAGFASRADAIAGCARAGFTGGPVRMTQYLGSDGFDADVVCG